MSAVQPCDLASSPVLEHLPVQPADNAACGTARAHPERVVGIETELQMMRGKARADQRELAGLRIVHGEMAGGLIDRKQSCRRVIGSLLAEVRIARRTDS